MWVSVVVGVLLAAVALLVGAAPASAHADLTASNPAADAVVDEAPTSVTLTFSESVTIGSQDLRVLDDRGDRVDEGNTRHGRSDTEVVVDLRDDLRDGTYVVDWRAISADAHPVHGGFQFSVGAPSTVDQAAVAAASGPDDDRTWQIAAGVIRFVAYVGALLATGGVLFRWWRKDPASTAGDVVVVAGAGVALVALAALVPVQAALSTGQGLTSITDDGVLSRVLSEGFGLSLGVSAIALVVLIGLSSQPNKEPVRTIGFVAALVAVAGFAITGHTRSMTPGGLSYLADGVHLVAAAVWFGGLVQLALVIRRARRDGTAVEGAYAVADWSALAAWALAGVVVGGLCLGWMEVRSIDALTSTTYGRVLLAKTTAVALVIAAGAWNRYRLVPVVVRDALPASSPAEAAGDGSTVATLGAAGGGGSSDPRPEPSSAGVATIDLPPDDVPPGDGDASSGDRAWRRLGGVVLAEIAGIVVVLALTAALVNITPARNAVDASGLFNATQSMGDGSVNLIVDPAKAGRNSVHVYLLDATGGADDSAESVVFQLSLPSKQLGPIDTEPVKVAPGHYQLLSNDLLYPGDWTLTVKARVSRFEEPSASFQVPVS